MVPALSEKLKIALLLAGIIGIGAIAVSILLPEDTQSCGFRGTLTVRITNPYTAPLPGVNVTLWVETELVRTHLTDATGETVFRHLPWGTYNLTATRRGSAFFSIFLDFAWSKIVTYTLPYLNYTLVFHVTDSVTHAPLPNATVWVYRYGYQEQYQEWWGQTNTTGSITFSGLEYDEYATVISKAGYSNASQLLFLEENTELSIPLVPIPGPPAAPVLQPIAPNPSLSGTITLNWTAVPEVAFYYVFRDTAEITSITGLTPIATVAGTSFQETLRVNGTYYYVILAHNNFGNSSPSNCEGVTVALTPVGEYLPNQNLLALILIGIIFGGVLFYFYRQRTEAPRHQKFAKWTYIKRGQVCVYDDATPGGKVPLSEKPDVFEGITFAALFLFFLAVFFNITLLGSPLEADRILATQYLAIAALGSAGLVMRAIYDHIQLRDAEGKIIGVGITSTVQDVKNPRSLLESVVYFCIAFSAQISITFGVMLIPLSFFQPNVNLMIMGIIGAVGEELFFSYFATGLAFRYIRWLAIPLVSIVFVFYHFVVYQSLTALIYVGIMRMVYATVYIFSRRLSSVTLAHVLNNILAGLRM
ncbi:MAG: carboxypeptidase regulatory-like domain-containing protein [Candidatus Helarchaeota archaeon]|nr:CPBP family intramembrane metalloprotease [Deltaproteobacteria bacterium]